MNEGKKNPRAGSVWQHWKGGVYRFLCTVTIEATDTPAACYMSMDPAKRDDFWVRPMAEFLERFKPLDISEVALAEIAAGRLQGFVPSGSDREGAA